MRIPRSIQLFEANGFVHKFWRCHNKERYLAKDEFKALYLDCTKKILEKPAFKEHVSISSYCAMDNHFHQMMSYSENSSWLSGFMRQVHSRFGSIYNRRNKRSGKVAEGRPKTPLIENGEHLARVQFYIEANPVAAGKMTLGMLKKYKYSSYRFYAFGVRDRYTEMITIPSWYVALGKTPKERQQKYRKLFVAYLKDKGIETENFLKAFIGTPLWIETKRSQVKGMILASSSEKFISIKSTADSS